MSTFAGVSARELREAVAKGPGPALAFFRTIERPPFMTAEHAQYEGLMTGLYIAERAVKHQSCQPCTHPYPNEVWQNWSRFLLRWMKERGV